MPRIHTHPGEVLLGELMKPLGPGANALALALRGPASPNARQPIGTGWKLIGRPRPSERGNGSIDAPASSGARKTPKERHPEALVTSHVPVRRTRPRAR